MMKNSFFLIITLDEIKTSTEAELGKRREKEKMGSNRTKITYYYFHNCVIY